MGHEVYDFRNPKEANTGFQWSDIDPKWQAWSPRQYRNSLDHPIAEAGFQLDIDALLWCDAVVAVQPFGRSASLELGWAAGAGKFTVLLLSEGEPELMVKMCDRICLGLGEVLLALQEYENAQATAPPPSPDERVAEMVEAAYREGWRDGHDEGTKANAHRRRLPNLWEHSKAKAALAAEKGGG